MNKKPGSILYVDDEENNLLVFRSTFKWDYAIYTATTGEEGLQILASYPVDLLITDHRMPGMTGLQLLQRTMTAYPDLVRILLTGYSEVEVIVEAINTCGIFRYLAKPWHEQDMQHTIELALETGQLRRENRRLIADLQQANAELEQKVLERTLQVVEQQALLEARKNRELSTLALKLVRKNEVLNDLYDLVQKVVPPPESELFDHLRQVERLIGHNRNADQDWETYKLHFEQVHPDFFDRLTSLYPHLTQADLRFCAYVRMNLSAKEIAQLMSVSVKAVQMARYRIKKKMGLAAETTLGRFILTF